MTSKQHDHHRPATSMMSMEITVISAQGLKTTSRPTLFSHKIRPFITLTTLPPYSPAATADLHKCPVYKTRVDDQGGINPTWGDKLHVPIHATFFSNTCSCIYLQLYTKGLIMGRTQLGWCQIPAHDIGLPPTDSPRYLSYRLRARDGSRTHGIVNISVKLEHLSPVPSHGKSNSVNAPSFDMCGTVIGTPVTALLPPLGECSGSCQGQFGQVGFRCDEADSWPRCDCTSEETGNTSRNCGTCCMQRQPPMYTNFSL